MRWTIGWTWNGGRFFGCMMQSSYVEIISCLLICPNVHFYRSIYSNYCRTGLFRGWTPSFTLNFYIPSNEYWALKIELVCIGNKGTWLSVDEQQPHFRQVLSGTFSFTRLLSTSPSFFIISSFRKNVKSQEFFKTPSYHSSSVIYQPEKRTGSSKS